MRANARSTSGHVAAYPASLHAEEACLRAATHLQGWEDFEPRCWWKAGEASSCLILLEPSLQNVTRACTKSHIPVTPLHPLHSSWEVGPKDTPVLPAPKLWPFGLHSELC